MDEFGRLIAEIEEGKREMRVETLERYLRVASPADASWAVRLLTGYRLKRLVSHTQLLHWAGEVARLPKWLVDASARATDDAVEASTLIVPRTAGNGRSLANWLEEWGHKTTFEDVQQDWQTLEPAGRFLYNRLLTGTFRSPMAMEEVLAAIKSVFGTSETVLAQRLAATNRTGAAWFATLVEQSEDAPVCAFPFCSSDPLKAEPESYEGWHVEWKWPGIRARIVRRNGLTSIWGRDRAFLNLRFPEIVDAAEQLPDGAVIECELLGWRDGILPARELARRLSGSVLAKRTVEETPVLANVYDLLEWRGEDVRATPLRERRDLLAKALHGVDPTRIRRSFHLGNRIGEAWGRVHDEGAEGLILKRLDAPYGKGWFVRKCEVFTFLGVLMYGQFDNAQSASLYTFGVWHEGEPISVAKVSEGLGAEDRRALDLHIKNNTLEKVGPIRTVRPEIVMELIFEGMDLSKRHKAGLVLRKPRIGAWRRDLTPEEAHSLEQLKAIRGE